MKSRKVILTLASVANTLFSPIMLGNELTLNTPSGENIVIYVQPEDCFLNVIDAIGSQLDSDFFDNQVYAQLSNEKRFQMDICVSESGVKAKVSKSKAAKSSNRDYSKELSQQDRDDIGYIVKTLAKENYLEVLRVKSSLQEAGDRIDKVHPLRFLECIFTDERLRSYMGDLSGKTLAWSNFLKGLKKSLAQEYKNGNLNQNQVNDFAKKVKADPTALMAIIKGQRWEELVTKLIGEGGVRYDM